MCLRGLGAVILHHLKEATRGRHVALESRSVLLDPRLSRGDYRYCLRRLFGYYAPLERRLLAFRPLRQIGIDYGERLKTPLLIRDLCLLGVTEYELAQDGLCTALPDLSTLARVMGCLYVIEGATLGGRVVIRHLGSTLAITAQHGGAFFSGYGERTGSHWRTFGAQLTAFALQSGSGDEIVRGAQDTFETLDHWLHPAVGQNSLGHELATQG